MKTRSFLFIAAILMNIIAAAQGPNWQWVKKGGGTSADEGRSITTDASGNSYITGGFAGATVTFGTITLTNFTSGSDDVFIVKYDPSGNVLWAKKGTGNGNDQGYGIACDPWDNVYITGSFNSTSITFGTTVLNNNSTSNLNDVFVVKYDPAGNLLWAKNAGGTGSEDGFGIAIGIIGEPYVTGDFNSPTFTFGTDVLTNSNTNAMDFFVLRYDTAGNEKWIRGAGGNGYEEGMGITSSAPGPSFIYVTGLFQSSSVTFGTSTVTNADVTGTSYDAFVASYDTLGNVSWATSIGGTDYDMAYGVSYDASNNVYVTGGFVSTALTFGNTILNSSANNDVFIAKLNSSGSPVWIRGGGGIDGDVGVSIVSDPTGNTFVTGYFGSASAAFSSDTLTNTSTSNQPTDVFVVKYDNSGTELWAKGDGGTDNDYGNSIALGSSGPMVTGWFNSLTASFDNITLTNTSSGSNADVFVGSLGSCPNSPPNICMVTVDSLSNNNIIIWDKTQYTNVDSFIVYREITTNVYKRIGAVLYDSLSQFIDTVRTLYFPNTGNPNGGTYRYKLQMLDSCGNYSPLGPYHNTIFMTHNGGTFTWPQLYTIENSPNPVNAYVLMRDDNSNGNWQAVNSVAGTQQSVTDPAYNVWVATANWRIETLWNITCTPTFKTTNGIASAYATSKSNTANTLLSVNEATLSYSVELMPNPSNGKFTLSFKDMEPGTYTVEILNILGSKIYSSEEKEKKVQIDLSSQPAGSYFIHVKTKNGVAVKKLLIQK